MTDVSRNPLLAGLLRQRDALDELISLAGGSKPGDGGIPTRPNDALVPVKDAADAMGVRVETTRRWAKAGDGCVIGKRWYLRKSVVDAGRRRARAR